MDLYIEPTHLEVQALEACIQMPLCEFWGEDDHRHQPAQRVRLKIVVVVLGFSCKNCCKQISQLGGLDRSRPGKEVQETLRKSRNSNVLDSAIVPVDIACGIHQLQHSSLELSKVNGLLVVPRFNDYFGRLLGSLDIFHCFDQLGKKIRRRVSTCHRGRYTRGKRVRWCRGAADRNSGFFDNLVVVDILDTRRSGVATNFFFLYLLVVFEAIVASAE